MKEVIKAGLKEIELATNGTLSHREITEAAEIFCSLSYVVVYYRESDEDWRGRAHVGRILGRGIKEKLGWSTYGNGWYPSENGWYTVKLKDRDNLFAVIRQDVNKGNHYAKVYFKVDYEMPDEWQ